MYVEYRAGKYHTNADALSRIPPAEPVMSMTHNLLGTSSVDMREQLNRQMNNFPQSSQLSLLIVAHHTMLLLVLSSAS